MDDSGVCVCVCEAHPQVREGFLQQRGDAVHGAAARSRGGFGSQLLQSRRRQREGQRLPHLLQFTLFTGRRLWRQRERERTSGGRRDQGVLDFDTNNSNQTSFRRRSLKETPG